MLQKFIIFNRFYITSVTSFIREKEDFTFFQNNLLPDTKEAFSLL